MSGLKKLFTKELGDEPKPPAPQSCCIFDCATAVEAGQSFKFEIIDVYSGVDSTYSWNECTKRLVRCKNCGALFL